MSVSASSIRSASAHPSPRFSAEVEDGEFVGSAEVGRGTRPTVGFGVRHQPGADRIALGIGQRGPEVVAVQGAGEEAVLPEVSGAAGPDVVVLGVTPVDAAQQDGQRVVAFGHGDEMDVVGHQTEAEKPRAGVGEVFGEEAQIGDAVLTRGEGVAPVDAALGDMAGDAGQQRAISSRHVWNSAGAGRRFSENGSVQADGILRLTPFSQADAIFRRHFPPPRQGPSLHRDRHRIRYRAADG